MAQSADESSFVDTWAWYPLVDVGSAEHELAQTANEDLLDNGYTFVTTNYVLAEAITLIRYNIHHSAAVQFRRMMQQMIDGELLELVRIGETAEVEAWIIFEKYADQKFSFADCTSFAVMSQLGLTEAFTADHHFAVMGFVLKP